MSIKEFDTYVIRLGNVYLVARPYEDSNVCRLSESVYDALQIGDERSAAMAAHRCGGVAVRFNPITGVVGA